MNPEQDQARIFEALGEYAESLGWFKGHRFTSKAQKALTDAEFGEYIRLINEKIEAQEGPPHLKERVGQIGVGRMFHLVLDMYQHRKFAGMSFEERAQYAYGWLVMALPLFGDPPLYSETTKATGR